MARDERNARASEIATRNAETSRRGLPRVEQGSGSFAAQNEAFTRWFARDGDEKRVARGVQIGTPCKRPRRKELERRARVCRESSETSASSRNVTPRTLDEEEISITPRWASKDASLW
jgi:hypothetical protein